ncbi:HAMP domain-containing histidine kinase [Fibrella sp. HMF5335]|uniref:histidine kinase n=1 Tax=Fibrella rubiginis TaxID=2817060 RepID=A0A939GM43_9BACT|nr:HAMP domain-containing sensor histidine kinase [Fibrella rubiginis]MBO0939884.1 HAMP domain-containing histidine kinase [Fibrella rubiginis]
MNIRTRLTLLFLLLVGSILLLFSLAIYLLYNQFREVDFYERLREQAKATVRVREDAGDVARTDLPVMVDERITIYTPDNQVAFTVGPGPLVRIPPSRLEKIRAGREFKFRENKHETLALNYHSKSGPMLVVVTTAYDRYGFNHLMRLRQILIFGWLASLLAVGVAGWLFASDALRPVSEIIEQVNTISGTNIHRRLQVSRQRDELAELARTFNAMLNRLEEAFVTQRSFVSHASHELRTPLAIMRGNIDVALMQPRNTQYYRQTLDEVLYQVQRMIDLANGLLDLARANTDAANLSFRPTRIDEVLWQARSNILSKKPEYSIDILFDFDDEALAEQDDDLTVPAEEALLRTALQNLMENGCKYSVDHNVTVRISFIANAVQVAFIDNGYGIPPEDLPHLFEPFYRSSHTTNVAPGHGIGLALTNRIVALHHGQLMIDSTLGVGTTVTVQLPVQATTPALTAG